MHQLKFTILLAIFGAATLTYAQAPRCQNGVGDTAAAHACAGFAPGVFRCLTDISYVVCPADGQAAIESCVQPGYRCAQGAIGKGDSAVQQSVTTIRTYDQWSAGQTSAPTAGGS